MAAVSLFWDINMAARTSSENTPLKKKTSNKLSNYVEFEFLARASTALRFSKDVQLLRKLILYYRPEKESTLKAN